MTNPNGARGSQFERDVVAVLLEHGFEDAERMYGAGRAQDRGDIRGVPGWTLECKDEKRINLSGYLAEAEREAANAGRKFFAAVVKRRGKNANHAYVVMPLSIFAQWIKSEGE